MPRSPTPRRVVVVVFPEVEALDVMGPVDVFSAACKLSPPGYAIEVVAPEPGHVMTDNGLSIGPARALSTARGPIDTLLVAGGAGVHRAQSDEHLIRFVRAAAGRSRRVASVCTGAFLLARAGLLDGRRATTHWAACDVLAEAFPSIQVEPDPIFVEDDEVFTSAGVTAGMDLALALVEADLGRRTALEVARWLVLFAKRPGGQSQFSARLSAQLAEREPLREVQEWVATHLTEDLSVPALAARAAMSERTFGRCFRREVGMTPAAYVESLRVEHARQSLESTSLPVEAVAAQSGFGTVETMRRAFHRRVGVGPADYRSRFRPSSAHPDQEAA